MFDSSSGPPSRVDGRDDAEKDGDWDGREVSQNP